jgi:hypothetical protein
MISFAIHSPTGPEAFWQSWIAGGIVTAPHIYTPDYGSCVQVHDFGIIPIMGTDDEGKPIVTGHKPGWYANAYVSGNIERAMIAGKPQYDEAGLLLPLFDRTWAIQVFGLTWVDTDPLTNFPAGYQTSAGIRYADAAQLITPYNVRL